MADNKKIDKLEKETLPEDILDNTSETEYDDIVIEAFDGDEPKEESENEDENQNEGEGIPATAEDDGEGIPITAEDEDEDDNAELCILCEKNPPDKSYGEDYDLCTQCRKKLVKSPIRFKGILALVSVLVCSFWGLLFLGTQADSLNAIIDGYAYLEENKPESALNNFSSVSNIGWKTAAKLVDVCYNLGSMDNVNHLISTYFYDANAVEEGDSLTWTDKAGQSNINAPWNKNVKERYDFMTLVNEHGTTYSKLFYEYYEGIYYGSVRIEDVPYDDIIKQYNDMLGKAETDLEKGIINYYMLAISSVCEKDAQTQYNYCLKISELAPECSWLYRENMIDLAIRTGNYDVATQGIADMRKLDSESVYADLYESILFRYQGKYTEAIAGFEALIETISEHEIYEAYYEILLCHFMAGNYEKAYEYASLCFNDEYYLTYETIYFYAMLSEQLGMEGGYKAAADLLATNKEKLSPTVDKYINGEITAEQLIKNGEVVFE